MQEVLASMRGIPPFVLYFAVSVALLGVFVSLYVRVTPYREFALIGGGNAAAATSLGGATIGFAMPLAKAIAQSSSLPDMLVWAGVAFVAQIAVYFGVRILFPGIVQDIPAGRTAAAIFLATVSVSVGVLNAACMTA